MSKGDYSLCMVCGHSRALHTDFEYPFDTACHVEECGCVEFTERDDQD
jgi:hypothetical protein